jgi:diguanylate cyclase (GGDEF)-like protein
VDDFGRINDQHGYGVADSMLLQLGDRLRRATPAADAVAHIFGDKFGILACGLPSLNDLETLALQLLRACNEPFLCNDISLRISVSIGIAEAPHDGAGTVELMKSANEALRSARARGGATWSVYTPSMRHNNSALSRALPDAIVNRALLPAYSRSQIRPRRRSGGAGALEPSHAWLGFSRCVYPDCRRRRNTE